MTALLKNYARKKISFVKGKGCYLYSSKGSKYLDFVQGIAVNSLGHCHSSLVKTINKQSKKLWHVSNAFIINEQEKLARRLTQNTFILKDSLIKIEYFVLIIVFMEELLLLFLQVITKK